MSLFRCSELRDKIHKNVLQVVDSTKTRLSIQIYLLTSAPQLLGLPAQYWSCFVSHSLYSIVHTKFDITIRELETLAF